MLHDCTASLLQLLDYLGQHFTNQPFLALLLALLLLARVLSAVMLRSMLLLAAAVVGSRGRLSALEVNVHSAGILLRSVLQPQLPA